MGMRDYLEPTSYPFQEFPKTYATFSPTYEGSFPRTRDPESDSSNYFSWSASSGACGALNEYNRPNTSQLVSPCRSAAAVAESIDQTACLQLASEFECPVNKPGPSMGPFTSFIGSPEEDPMMRIKDESGSISDLNYDVMPFPSLPSFQPNVSQPTEQQPQESVDPSQELLIQLISKNTSDEPTPMMQSAPANLDKLIDECMSHDPLDDNGSEIGNFDTDFATWALGLCELKPYPSEMRDCRWQDCSFRCDNQEELVSLTRLSISQFEHRVPLLPTDKQT